MHDSRRGSVAAEDSPLGRKFRYETRGGFESLVAVSSRAIGFVIAVLGVLGCSSAPVAHRVMPPPAVATVATVRPGGPGMTAGDGPRTSRLGIDWATTRVSGDDEALALWQRIAPTGADWDEKLPEVPTDKPIARALAIALLHGGNFRCPAVVTTHNCRRHAFDLERPKPTDGLDAPCLRRLLALWSIDQLEAQDRATVRAALLDIVQLPPPESQLISAALQTLNEGDHDEQMLFYETAWKAGQHDLVNAVVGNLDVPHLIEAVTRLHIDGALEILSGEAHRSAYLAAIGDDQLATRTRITAMTELAAAEPKLSFDVKSALIAAVSSPDCAVAAAAARTLQDKGLAQYLPVRPRLHTDKALLRGLCVLASYEALQHADEPSLLASYLPARGLERVAISYDVFSEVDTDGDGDPHTQHETVLVPRAEAVIPDSEDVARAMTHCTGTTCASEDREYRFTFRAGQLYRLELVDRPPCLDKPEVSKP